MSWCGRLVLDAAVQGARTVCRAEHVGPLRLLKSLYPEGGVCHAVLVHPPGGIVGGDLLEIEIALAAASHLVLTTPGATRFYRSTGAPAAQQAGVRVAAGARLEWLPLESIAYPGCIAGNALRLDLAEGAEAIAWDVTALGLPASGAAFDHGSFAQEIAAGGHFLERARVRGDDARLLDSPLGWAGRRVLATLLFASGSALPAARRETLVDAAREAVDDGSLESARRTREVGGGRRGEDMPAMGTRLCGGDVALATTTDAASALPVHASSAGGVSPAAVAGVTSPDARVVVVRVLATAVEPAFAVLRRVRARWRRLAWALDACEPRVWRT